MRRADAAALLALVGFVGLGLSDGILGPAWPSIRRALDQPVGALGILQTIGSAGFAVAAVGSARLRARLGAGRYLALGAAGIAVGLVGFAVSPSWAGVLAAMLVVGAAAAFLDVGFNAHAALHFDARLTNALHASYGVGTTIGPLVVAAALAAGTWRIAFVVAAVVNAVVGAGIWAVRRRIPSTPPERWAEREHVERGRTLVLLMLAVFFVLTGVEVAIGSWAPTLLADGRGLGESTAAVWVAVYWGAFTGGRVLLALAGARLAPTATLRAGTALALAGVVVFWRDPGGAGTLGLPLAGLGLAGLFPALVLLTPLRLGPERAAAAVGRQLAAATLGATAGVALGGVVAQVAGVRALGPYLAAIAAVLVALELAAARAARPASMRPTL